MSGIIHADAARQLTYYDAARGALAEALRVDDVKDVVNKAAATAEYARRAKDGELLGYATSIRLYAERRAGELLAAMKANGERDTGRGDRKAESREGIPLLSDLGVTPAKWKRHFGLDADKEKARALALRYWPARSDLFGRKKDHGRAEAALLARYAAEVVVKIGRIV